MGRVITDQENAKGKNFDSPFALKDMSVMTNIKKIHEFVNKSGCVGQRIWREDMDERNYISILQSQT